MLIEPEKATYAEFCENAEGHLKRLKKFRRPTYILNRGKPEAVLLTAKQFAAYSEGREFLDTVLAVEESRRQFALGLSRPWEEVKKGLRRKFATLKRRSSKKP